MNKRILIIDDDADICALLSRFLMKKGYDTETALSGNKGMEKFKKDHYDIVLCDFRLGDKKDGKEILLEIKQHNPSTIVIIITGYSDIKIAVDVIKAGAFDYITKPLIPDEVLNVIANAVNQPLTGNTVQHQSPTDEVKQPRKKPKNNGEFFRR